jgi:hypothetical protein
MIEMTLSGGDHGGEVVKFESDTPGTNVDFPINGSQRVHRYELRAVTDLYGDDTGQRCAVYVGVVLP